MSISQEDLQNLAGVVAENGAVQLRVREEGDETLIQIDRDTILNLADASAFLRLSPNRVRDLVHAGKLSCMRSGDAGTGKFLFSKNQLMADITRLTDFATYVPGGAS